MEIYESRIFETSLANQGRPAPNCSVLLGWSTIVTSVLLMLPPSMPIGVRLKQTDSVSDRDDTTRALLYFPRLKDVTFLSVYLVC